MKVVGIDPGNAGGIVELVNGQVANRMPMPVREVPVAGRRTKKRTVLDEERIAAFLRERRPDVVVIEDVHALPGQGVSSMFAFGLGKGVLQGVCAGLGITYVLVPPRTWQKSAGGPTEKHADDACRALWPDVDWKATARSRTPHSGMQDAALMAAWFSGATPPAAG